jgi:hypothetical protein
MQEIVAETQAEGNNRENQSHFREQPAEQNSSPVDSCSTHFPTPVPHVERSTIIPISNECKPVFKSICLINAKPYKWSPGGRWRATN